MPLGPLTSTPLPARDRNRLALLRLLSAVSMQFGYLLAPLLAFHLTGSLAVAGASLLMDGVARAAAQLFSGALLSRLGPSRVHVLTEGVRLLGLAGLLLCATGVVPGGGVVAMTFFLQLATSASLTLYSHVTSRYWPPAQQAAAHHQQGFLDQAGCLAALLVGLTVASPLVLAAVAVAGQALGGALLWRWLSDIHPSTSSAPPPDGALTPRGALTDLRACWSRPLLRFSAGVSLAYAAAMVGFTVPVFLLAAAGVPQESLGRWLAGTFLAKSVFALAALHGTKKWSATAQTSTYTGRAGIAAMLLGLLVLVLPLPAWGVGLSAVVMGAGAALLAPHLRFVRQRLIHQTVAPASRAGATGVLSAVEAGGFFLAGGLTVLSLPLPWLVGSAVLLGVASLPLLERSYARVLHH